MQENLPKDEEALSKEEEELKRRNMKGLMAELETMDTPMMAWEE